MAREGNMRFGAVRSVEQPVRLSWHRLIPEHGTVR